MLRKLLAAAAVLVVLVAVAVVLLARGAIGTDTLRRALEAQLSSSLGQPVTIGRLGATYFPRVAIDLHDITIGEPSGATIAEVSLVTGLRSLLSRRVEDAELIVSNSRIPLGVALGIVGATTSARPAQAGGAGLTVVSVKTLSFRHVEVVSPPYTLLIDLESALTGDRLDVSRLSAQSDKTRIDIHGVLTSIAQRRGTFTATANTLNLDELLAVVSAMASNSQRGRPAAKVVQASAPTASTPMDVAIDLTAPSGVLGGYAFQTLAAKLRVRPAEVLLQPFDLALFGGTFGGRLSVATSGSVPEMALNGAVHGMDVARILRETRGSTSMSGTLTGKVSIDTRGESTTDLMSTARGDAQVTIANGVIPGLEMVRAVVLAFGKPSGVLPGGSGSAFTTLDGNFTLADRTLRSSNLAFHSRDFDMTGNPVVRLATGAIDMHANVMLSRELTSQAGTDLRRFAQEDGRVVVPAVITGTVAAPSVTIDAAAALKRALQNEMQRRIKGLFDKIRK
jgi:uncharacterized protein involved in outer membrane biogenesis